MEKAVDRTFGQCKRTRIIVKSTLHIPTLQLLDSSWTDGDACFNDRQNDHLGIGIGIGIVGIVTSHLCFSPPHSKLRSQTPGLQARPMQYVESVIAATVTQLGPGVLRYAPDIPAHYVLSTFDIRPRITLSNNVLARGVGTFIGTLAVAGLVCFAPIPFLPVLLRL